MCQNYSHTIGQDLASCMLLIQLFYSKIFFSSYYTRAIAPKLKLCPKT